MHFNPKREPLIRFEYHLDIKEKSYVIETRNLKDTEPINEAWPRDTKGTVIFSTTFISHQEINAIAKRVEISSKEEEVAI